jgi:DUF438 domain-containing protein
MNAIAQPTFEELTDEELTEAVRKQSERMSFYNAAESNWSSETTARNACRAKLNSLGKELARRNLPYPKGDYLL